MTDEARKPEADEDEPRQQRGVLRIETGALKVPDGIDASKPVSGSGRVVAVIAALALLFVAFVAWLIHGGQ